MGAYLTSQEPPQPLLQLGATIILGIVMGIRFYNSGKFMPAGLVFSLSIALLIRSVFMYGKYLPGLGGSDDIIQKTE